MDHISGFHPMLQTSSRLSDFAVGATAGTVCGIAGCGVYRWHETNEKNAHAEKGKVLAIQAVQIIDDLKVHSLSNTSANKCIEELKAWAAAN
jgi:hypothetical protein